MDHHLDFSTTLNGAWFLPSLQPIFVRTISRDLYDLRGEHRPRSFFSTSQLNFLDPIHGFFFYPCALYSAGQCELDLARGKRSEAIIHNRDREKTKLIADSGGYQIINDQLAIDWNAPDATLLKILQWMEAVADAGMTVDVPLHAIGTNPRFPTFDACLKQTLYNLSLFEQRQAGTLDLINCLHGRTDEEAKRWYDEVKQYRFAGWAFGGALGNNLFLALRQIIRMRDEERLSDVRWLHFFGHATGHSAIVFEMLHFCLKTYVNRKLQVTYDASSPFLKSRFATVDLYYTHHVGKNPSRLTYERFDDSLKYNNPEKPYPDAWSPVMRNITVGDIISPKQNKRGNLDSLSHAIIQAHNTFVAIKAIEDALFVKTLEMNCRMMKGDTTIMASEAIGITQIIDDVVRSETPFSLLDRYRTPLEDFFAS